ncbi:hypothetical protein D5086_004076 [Populus alba]|uniref:Uncharacterized protein n=1 Tax=Populus alba TaxID=43335 RepID=A0ACC4CPR0_POPAL
MGAKWKLSEAYKKSENSREEKKPQQLWQHQHLMALLQIIMEMWSVYFSVLVIILLVISTTHWIYRWRNPKYNGNLPPGSMGFPYIGETLQFLIPSKLLDIPNFIKKRMRNLAGRPVIVKSDPDFNFNLLQQEGKLVERWYMDSFAKLLHQDATSVISKHGSIHKYLRNLVLAYFGPEPLKDKLLPKLETAISQALQDWSKRPTIEVKSSSSSMTSDFTAKVLFSYESEKSGENIAESFTNFLQGLMSIPLNTPGTAFHRCLKKENFWTGEFAIYMMFGLLLASFETISSTLALAFKFLTDHPPVVQKLKVSKLKITETLENKLLMKIDSVPSQVEHERILERRKGGEKSREETWLDLQLWDSATVSTFRLKESKDECLILLQNIMKKTSSKTRPSEKFGVLNYSLLCMFLLQVM